MKPLIVRPPTDAEFAELRAGLRSAEAFTLRRCQYLLASAEGRAAASIAATSGGSPQSVRNAVRAFADRGAACLRRGSAANTRPRRAWPRERDADLEALLRRSPRDFGKPTGLWTLALLASVCRERGGDRARTQRRGGSPGAGVPGRVVEAREALARQPRPRVRRPKKARDDLIAEADANPDWVLGFQDECRWTRLGQPDRRSRAAGEPLRLAPNGRDPRGGGPEAVACYGVLRADTGGVMLRFCTGRPVGAATVEFLGWVCRELAAEGKRVFALVWDNAAWHVSKRVAAWIGAHNERVTREGGWAIRACRLPVKAPWLNRIEPKWVHAKRAVAEPSRKLGAEELKQRACDYLGCMRTPDLQQAA